MIGPFWRYYGGKWRAAPKYPPPTRGVIVEPFAGAAGYACRHPDRDVLLVDKDPVVVSVWRFLIDATADDVLAIPDAPEGGTIDDIDAPEGARNLVGFWYQQGGARPGKTPSRWARESLTNGWSYGRARVARWVDAVSHWCVMHGSYHDAPDIDATWFVDPPYQTSAGRHYVHSEIDYGDLGAWVLSRYGQVIACDQDGATWLPWTSTLDIQAAPGRHKQHKTRSAEVVYIAER